MSASVIFPCTIKPRRRFLLAPAHPGSPGKRRKMTVSVCVCITRVPYGVHIATAPSVHSDYASI